MINFVTFDDGQNFVAISEIRSFGIEHDDAHKGGTVIKLRDGSVVHSQWSVTKVAEKLGPPRTFTISRDRAPDTHCVNRNLGRVILPGPCNEIRRCVNGMQA